MPAIIYSPDVIAATTGSTIEILI